MKIVSPFFVWGTGWGTFGGYTKQRNVAIFYAA
jgi:hypothetical protein